MKKTLFSMLAAIMLCLTGAQAQTYTTGRITAMSMPALLHDSTWCHSTGGLLYMITITSSFVGDTFHVVDTLFGTIIYSGTNTTGANPWTSIVPVNMYNSVVTDDQLMGGPALFVEHPTKIISGPDTVGPLHDFFPLFVSNPCVYDTVSGTVYEDYNSDCIYDAGDTALNGMELISNNNLSSPSVSTNYRITYSNYAGYYNLKIQKSWMTSYSVALPSQYYFIFPLTSCFSGAYSYTTLPHAHVDFPLLCGDSVDVMSYSCYPPAIKAGRSFFMEPYVSNTGCDTVSGTLTFVKDPRVIYNPSLSTDPATYFSGDTLQWTFTDFTNLSGGSYWNSMLSKISLSPDTSAHVGDTLCFRIYSTIPPTDIDHSNNDQTICLPVVYAYDPNEKAVSPAGTGTPGYISNTTPKLTYTLFFQNTGTAAANDVHITDTLDANVDAASLRVLGVSHFMTPKWLTPNVVDFDFPYINLPDSTDDEAGSHGSVSFSVKLNPSLPVGTQIKNKGYIYFDANPAVITNTTLNTISGSLTTNTIKTAAGTSIYPNPAHDVVYVEGIESGSVTITDMSGAVVAIREITTNQTAIDVSKLANGIYLMRIVSNDEVTTSKLIKL